MFTFPEGASRCEVKSYDPACHPALLQRPDLFRVFAYLIKFNYSEKRLQEKLENQYFPDFAERTFRLFISGNFEAAVQMCPKGPEIIPVYR